MKVMINSVHFKADQKLEDFITQKVEKLCASGKALREVQRGDQCRGLTETRQHRHPREQDRRHPSGASWRGPVCQ